MLMVTRAPLVMVPRLQNIVPFMLVGVPSVLVRETRLTIEGSASVKTTSEAVLGPRLVRLMV